MNKVEITPAALKRLLKAERDLFKIKRAAFKLGFLRLGGVLTASRYEIKKYLKGWPDKNKPNLEIS